MNRKNLIILFSLFLTGISIFAVTPARAEVYEVYKVYTDAGIPTDSEVWTWDSYRTWGIGTAPATFNGNYSGGVPEDADTCFQTIVNNGNTYAGWGVFLIKPSHHTVDLSNYESLKLWIKASKTKNDLLKIEIEDTTPGGITTSILLNCTTSWQEVNIPASYFNYGGADVDFSQIFSPFKVTMDEPGTFYIDNVRWVRQVEMPGASKVEVIGRQLFVDDNLFTVKGVCYSPTPVGEYHTYDWSSYPDNYGKDFALLRAMGCNTIKIYKPPTQIAAMDAAYLNGIYVIMDYSISWSADVSDPATRESIKNGFLDMVNTWKDHPAVLMWNLGNEMNAHVSSLSNWYSLVNECAQAAHSVDPNHPVTAACQDVTGGIEGQIASFDSSVPDMDIWSVQIYRGNSFGGLFTSFASKSSKPLLLTEFGCDAYDGTGGSEDQDTQSTYIDSQWAEINNNLSSTNASNVSIGGCVFEWSDEWWKHDGGSNSVHDTATDWPNPNYPDPNMNEEWWGIMSVAPGTYHKTQRQAWYTLQGWWVTAPLLSVTLKKISDNTVPAEQSLTWKNVNPGVNIWKLADQYLQVDADTSFSDWGVQIYTDNCAADADPQFYIVNPSSVNPAGLLATDDRTGRIPLCWKITDELWTASSPPPEQGGPGPGPQDPVEVPDPTIPNAYYFENNYLWMKDRGTPDDPETPSLDETFADGEYYVTVWDQQGIQWGGDPAEHGGGMSSPNYIYIGGKFINATTPRTYKTNKMTLEMYFP